MRELFVGFLLLGVALAFRSAPRKQTLYVAVIETRGGFVVGAANAASGLHRYDGDSTWTHLGWRNVRDFGVAGDPERPEVLYLACGNGAFRSRDGGESWRITTAWDVTEVLDVVVDPHAPDNVYIATAYGVWHSPDGADTWTEANDGIPAPQATFTQTIEVDRVRAGALIVGSEEGLYRSTDGAAHWVPVGPRGVAIRDVRQSTADPGLWLAGAEDQGVLLSEDGGATWRFAAGPIADETIYAVAVDPFNPDHLAAAGYQTGVFVSTDRGKSWTQRTEGLSERNIHAVVFDPAAPGRLWVGTYGGGVFRTDDDGRGWTHVGLDGAVIYDMDFIGGV